MTQHRSPKWHPRSTGRTSNIAKRQSNDTPQLDELGSVDLAGTDPHEELPSDTVEFAHNSERQFAKLLDFYEIQWEYEPRSFEIEWDKEGNPTQKFTPDFYLPAYDLFIEITTMNQKLVTKKNRKVRRLRQLYPDFKCKIFYQRDYLNLLVKYGLEEPSQIAERKNSSAKSVG
jgi:hypothetical protein